MTAKKRPKTRKTYSLDMTTVQLLDRVATNAFGGNASAALEEAVRQLARQQGITVLAAAEAMKRRRKPRLGVDAARPNPVISPEEVFWGLLEWGRDVFGNDFFEGTYAVDPQRGPQGALLWTFIFDLAAYERVRANRPPREEEIEPLDGGPEEGVAAAAEVGTDESD